MTVADYNVALIKEQGVTFAVVAVKDYVVADGLRARQAIAGFSFRLGCPVVLLGSGRLQYRGRTDLVRFLQNIHPNRLPWRRLSWAA